ncbi:AAA family ATPase [Mucilaginibacter sp. McL0603]|uniref:AAA family ATPase n=1 Tax=Mucilaginibacter sp. McL0603 TaxID=3415670 RepID=UPI003CF28A12
MIYLKKFTRQDLRAGGGGSNTLIGKVALETGFFPAPLRPPGVKFDIYHGSAITPVYYGYSGSVLANTEVRLKNFSQVMTAENVAINDIGIFKKHVGVTDAYDVTFVKQSDPDFAFYNDLMTSNHVTEEIIVDEDDASAATVGVKSDFPYNWLIYGAPGTGKSKYLETESAAFGKNILRVTFYPDYSYAKFVGSYKPSTYYRSAAPGITFRTTRSGTVADAGLVNEPVIDYRFVPGPFLAMLVKAWKSQTGENFVLIIEELNRSAAAAVFGEVFQLLDRKKGVSEYRVRLSDEAMAWVCEALADAAYDDIRSDIEENGIFIPANLFLWATMNSADQGVFPLDAAFKRRWQVKYLPLNANEDKLAGIALDFGGTVYQWNYLRKAINNYLTNTAGVAEDRLIAPFFLSLEELSDPDTAREVFKNKLLLYLKDDVLRHKKGFFNQDNLTISAISDNFREKANGAESWNFFSVLSEEAAAMIKNSYDAFNAALVQIQEAAVPDSGEAQAAAEPAAETSVTEDTIPGT